MYTAYFGFKEAPFTIAPNPAFLFMSDRHREALAHLTYGLENTGGFVLLTGEVGTGKTTICRSVMEQLPEYTQAAFILNPTLSCLELLATLCDNLKIRYKKSGATLKYLTDKIHDKLLKNYQNNINTLLVIDEAQHLQPEVLEQLRLLTNLETNTQKLLKVILIGQPELQQLLQRRDLRQLAQRITARYHLLALTKPELAEYIKHRLSVAECTRELFTRSAINQLHLISKGIPRVINLLCERALLIAYGDNCSVVSDKIVKRAAIEALGDDGRVVSFWWQTPMKALYLVSMVGITLAGGYWVGVNHHSVVDNATAQMKPIQEKASIGGGKQKSAEQNIEAPSSKSLAIADYDTNEITDSVVSALGEDISEQADVIPQESVHKEAIKQETPQEVLVLGYQPQEQQAQQPTIEIKPATGVSDDVLARFQAAVAETSNTQQQATKPEQSSSIKPLTQMPQWLQNAIPKLKFEMHIYASDGQGWVRVNGQDAFQGDEISQGLLLTEILPQSVVMTYQGEQFTMPALSTW